MRLPIVVFVLAMIVLHGCQPAKKDSPKIGFSVLASVESKPVKNFGDAADDPAIWVHPTRKEKSLIFGTDKQAGIHAYGLDGKEKAFYPVGKINNIDVGYGFWRDSQQVDILVATNRTMNTLEIYTIDPGNGLLRSVTSEAIFSYARDVYGVCTYKSKADSQMYAFVSGKDGELEQWKILNQPDGMMTATAVRKIRMESTCEGMVADDELGFLYIAEEDQAIWRLYAHPDSGDDYFLVSSLEGNPNMAPDIEGLTLYNSGEGEGFLIASSQGNDSYAVFKRTAPYPYLGSFRIDQGEGIDGTSSTDGIAASSVNFGDAFPNGIFIAQDDRNEDAEGKLQNQNFKFVRWELIADSLAK